MRLEYFQLVDRVIDLDLGALSIRAEAHVPQASTIFEGHFPGRPLMPGVLLIETMAQTSGWLIIARTAFERMPFLAAVKDAKLRSFVEPGQVLEVSARLDHEGSGYCMANARIEADGKPVCSASITFRLMRFPNETFKNSMRQVAARVALPMEAPVDG